MTATTCTRESRCGRSAAHVQVKDAKLDNGMLKIVLVREIPEAMKPRRIGSEVAGYDHQKIEQKQAA